MNKPLISVIIPVYNSAPWLDDAIESCLNQTYENVEIIVVDDGSTDDSLHVARKYSHLVRVFSRKKQSASAARNFGFQMSHGEYIAYLDADDVFVPTKLSTQWQHLVDTDSHFVYSDWRIMRPDHLNLDAPIKLWKFDDLLLTFLHDKYPEECIIVGASLFKRSLIEQVKWNEAVSVQDDHLFNFEIALLRPRYSHVPGVCVHYRRDHKPNTLGTKFRINEGHLIESYESMTLVYEKFYTLLSEQQLLPPQYIYPLIDRLEEFGVAWEPRSKVMYEKVRSIIGELKTKLLEYQAPCNRSAKGEFDFRYAISPLRARLKTVLGSHT